jgi:acyl-CoA thioester hydrolase
MGAAMAAPFAHRLRVRYHECDQQGRVFNAHYFAYFDIALTELWRAAFGSYEAVVSRGVDVVVVQATARFRAPACFDDEIDVEVVVARMGGTSLTLEPTVRRDGELLVAARTVHVCVDPATMAKREIPGFVREGLEPYGPPADGEHELAALERSLQRAVADRDRATLERLLGPEFTLTTGRVGHEVRGRAEYLEVTATSYIVESFGFESLDVLELGPDAAVVRSRYVQRASMDGADRSQPYLMTDAWARRPGGWQIVSRHVSPL